MTPVTDGAEGDSTRWLTDRQQRAWRAFIRAKLLLDNELDRQLQRDAGMPHTYYAILVSLSEAENQALRMSDLAATLCYSASRLSHAVSRMEAAGWVRRLADPDDRRGTRAILTEEGFDTLRAAAPGHVDCVRENIFDRLTDEQVEVFGDACEAILAGLSPGALSPGAPPPGTLPPGALPPGAVPAHEPVRRAG